MLHLRLHVPFIHASQVRPHVIAVLYLHHDQLMQFATVRSSSRGRLATALADPRCLQALGQACALVRR